MLGLGRNTLLVLTLAVMAAAAGFIIYMSRQVAQARDNPNTHAAKVQRAIEQAEDMMQP